MQSVRLPPNLSCVEQVRAKAEEERLLREQLDAEVADDILIGMFLVSLSTFKSSLLAKHERCTVRPILCLV